MTPAKITGAMVARERMVGVSRNWTPKHSGFPQISLLERFVRLVMRSDSITATEIRELSRHFLLRPHATTSGLEAHLERMVRNERWRNTLEHRAVCADTSRGRFRPVTRHTRNR